MTSFHEFLRDRLETGGFTTEDALATFLPLVRETLDAHAVGMVAPLQGLDALHVEGVRAWFEEARRLPLRNQTSVVRRIGAATHAAVEIIDEARRTSDLDEGQADFVNLAIGEAEKPITHPVYLPGYLSWEQMVEHHDPLTDVFSLGMILASLACGLDFNESEDLRAFVGARRNLFGLAPDLHPVLARAITKMTEVDRHRRVQDLSALLATLENYRDQEIDFEFDLARIRGFGQQDTRSKQQVVLTKLRERLFELSRRNRLLHFRPTMQSVNLTHASVPLSFDIKNIRADQILTWNDRLQSDLCTGRPLSLNKYLNFAEALYLPSVLDKIIAEIRRDQAEFGFAQLRLVACFLHWANLKEKPVEQFDSPLVLLPVRLKKKKGIRDTYALEVLSPEAEVNPVIRHQFKQLYDIDLPETLDLAATSLDEYYDYLARKVESSDVAVTLTKVDRPRIQLIHEKARRKLDQYRRRARLAGRGVRSFMDLDYSYDPANYHPLGIKLFTTKVRTPSTHLREVIEEKPRPRTFVAPQTDPPVTEKERTFFSLQEGGDDNPYSWTFDLCSVTLANFKYRKMSLVRDYEALLAEQPANAAFEATFSLTPRPLNRAIPNPPPLAERYDVVPCDPTQAAAIEEAESGDSYIIQGPPGTGKSQTITNLIADYVARGKRVLFVCEKRAAIDVVYARLRQCGVSDLCCLIHDSQTDKKEFVMDLKQTYEKFLDEDAATNGETTRAMTLDHLAAELAPLEQFDAAMNDAPPTAGVSVRQLIGRCVELRDRLPGLSPIERERLPNYAAWWESREAIARYETALAEIQPDRVAAHHPLSLLSPRLVAVEHPFELLLTTGENIEGLFARLDETLGPSGVPRDQWATIFRSRALIDYARKIQPVSQLGRMKLLNADSQQAKDFRKQVQQLRSLRKDLDDAREINKAWRQKLPATEAPLAIEQARAFERNFFAWLRPAWWRLRGILKRAYDFNSHVVRPSWTYVLERLRDEYERLERFQAQEATIAKQVGIDGKVEDFVGQIAETQEAVTTLPNWLQRIHRALLKSDKSNQIVDMVVQAHDPAESLRREIGKIADDFEKVALEDLRQRIAAALDSLDDLADFLQCLGEVAALPQDVSTSLRNMPYAPPQVEAAVADRSLEEAYRRHRSLMRFNGGARRRHVARLEKLYDRWQRANAHEIRGRVRKRFLENIHLAGLPAAQLTPDQKVFKKHYNRGRRELEHEFGKSMRYKPIRDLVSGDSGEVVKDLKPVWLMSPLSVSDTLPLDTRHFDVVIFDEASQITLEEAVPSVFRACQAIVVGDEMQLPPTDFFSAKRSEDEEELLIEEGGELVQYDLESNSFLNHAAKNLPSTMLGWHYRSRSESLISFSNWTFYDGRLLTVPEERLADQAQQPIRANDPAEGEQGALDALRRPISFHRIENGVYDKRRNRQEADYIAHMVRKLLMDEAGLTIGIVAFSEAQQDEIEGALQQLAQQDKEFAHRFDAELEREEDDQFVGLLVKNLENIQGDERDIIILSVCYGYGPNKKMRMNFGPINKSGGEKRLNVAFSRAKRHMALVSSIQHADITNDYNDGANCLKQYLRYAEAVSEGNAETASRILHGMSRWNDAEDPAQFTSDAVAEQLAEALGQRGYEVDHNVGQSHFRCDLAVRRDGDAVYRLGILVDGPAYYEQSDLIEREMMRPKLLRNFGWRITHVLAKDWYADADDCLDRVIALLECEEEPIEDEEDSLGDDNTPAADAQSPTTQSIPLAFSGATNELTGAARLPGATEDAATSDAEPMASVETRYLEFRGDNSRKFWQITLDGHEHTVRFGRLGTAGQSRTKSFSDEAAAKKDYQRLIREKLAKGYEEQ